MRNILPIYLSIGVSEERFWEGTPNDLKPFVIAHEKRVEERDIDSWKMGLYVESACYSAVARVLGGNNVNVSYLKKPFVETHKKENRATKEEDKKKLRENFLLRLQALQANFEVNHNREE